MMWELSGMCSIFSGQMRHKERQKRVHEEVKKDRERHAREERLNEETEKTSYEEAEKERTNIIIENDRRTEETEKTLHEEGEKDRERQEHEQIKQMKTGARVQRGLDWIYVVVCFSNMNILDSGYISDSDNDKIRNQISYLRRRECPKVILENKLQQMTAQFVYYISSDEAWWIHSCERRTMTSCSFLSDLISLCRLFASNAHAYQG